jgi:cellulose synthase/poly-beta-1,6-N-acetylglucosamine synthase-like glycosyltransferase
LNNLFVIKQDSLLILMAIGGVWRKSCIEDAGNWHADTLTEDLDLSYRAQLNGWKFVFLKDFTSPAELPQEINALKSQQSRWTKGAIETAKNSSPRLEF